MQDGRLDGEIRRAGNKLGFIADVGSTVDDSIEHLTCHLGEVNNQPFEGFEEERVLYQSAWEERLAKALISHHEESAIP